MDDEELVGFIEASVIAVDLLHEFDSGTLVFEKHEGEKAHE
jgi:hypothetical protein